MIAAGSLYTCISHKHEYCTRQGTGHNTIQLNEQPYNLSTKAVNDYGTVQSILKTEIKQRTFNGTRGGVQR